MQLIQEMSQDGEWGGRGVGVEDSEPDCIEGRLVSGSGAGAGRGEAGEEEPWWRGGSTWQEALNEGSVWADGAYSQSQLHRAVRDDDEYSDEGDAWSVSHSRSSRRVHGGVHGGSQSYSSAYGRQARRARERRRNGDYSRSDGSRGHGGGYDSSRRRGSVHVVGGGGGVGRGRWRACLHVELCIC